LNVTGTQERTTEDHAAARDLARVSATLIRSVLGEVRDGRLDEGGVQGAKLVRRLELAVDTLDRIAEREEREIDAARNAPGDELHPGERNGFEAGRSW